MIRQALLKDLVERTKVERDMPDEYWLKLCDDIGAFLDSCNEEEYTIFLENAYWDVPAIICDGIRTGK